MAISCFRHQYSETGVEVKTPHSQQSLNAQGLRRHSILVKKSRTSRNVAAGSSHSTSVCRVFRVHYLVVEVLAFEPLSDAVIGEHSESRTDPGLQNIVHRSPEVLVERGCARVAAAKRSVSVIESIQGCI